jgi:hypothetical protein
VDFQLPSLQEEPKPEPIQELVIKKKEIVKTEDPKEIQLLRSANIDEVAEQNGLPNFKFIRLDGVAIDNKGNIFKTDYLKSLNLTKDEYNNIILSREKAVELIKRINQTKTGLGAVVPMLCTGNQCPFAAECPYVALDIAPIGLHCAVEVDLIETLSQEFIREYNVDKENLTEIALIREIAETYIYERRATIILNTETRGTLGDDEIIGFDQATGAEIKRKTLHWAWNLKERCKNRRMKNFEALLGTRKEKLKEKVALGIGKDDVATAQSDLRQRFLSYKSSERKIEDANVIQEDPKK